MVFLRLFLSSLALIGLLMTAQPAVGVKPMAPLKVEIGLGAAPQVGGEFPVLLKVGSMMDAPLVKVQCILPEGVVVISGEDTWEGELKEGSVKEMTVILSVRKPGKYLIRAVVEIEYPGGSHIGREVTLLIDLEQKTIEKIKPGNQGPSIRKGKDGQDIGDFPLE